MALSTERKGGSPTRKGKDGAKEFVSKFWSYKDYKYFNVCDLVDALNNTKGNSMTVWLGGVPAGMEVLSVEQDLD